LFGVDRAIVLRNVETSYRWQTYYATIRSIQELHFKSVQDRQRTYNVTLGCVRTTIVAVEEQ
jgi:hypothetical protein